MLSAGALKLEQASKLWAYVPSMTALNLADNRLGEEGIVHLVSVFRKFENLSVLFLNGNELGDAGVISLMDAMLQTSSPRSLRRIRELHLAQNNLGPVGVRRICKTFIARLATGEELFVLNLRENPLTDDAGTAEALAALLAQRSELAELCLDECQIGDTVARALAEVLALSDLEVKVGVEGNEFQSKFGNQLRSLGGRAKIEDEDE
mmetsp:Transcript_23697/g.56555  ORF Transcript_23697/g.56555 Transcript_23697/m.56555 type:complete len:207 (+) Transcript_23697:14-634(+)